MWPIEGQSSQCDEVAQPLSVCQSCCHGGGPWILAATQAGLSSHRHGSASAWEALVLPPPVFSVPFCFTTSFYLNFTSCPFSVYYFLRSSPGSRSTGNEGGTLRGVEFFLSFLAPIANRHKALWPFLHAFHTLHLSLLLLSLYEKRRFSAGQFLFSGLLTSVQCLNKA